MSNRRKRWTATLVVLHQGEIAQRGRAPDRKSGRRGFDSLSRHQSRRLLMRTVPIGHLTNVVRTSGRALFRQFGCGEGRAATGGVDSCCSTAPAGSSCGGIPKGLRCLAARCATFPAVRYSVAVAWTCPVAARTVVCFEAGVAHLVERGLAKAEVAGSSPVSRSIRMFLDRCAAAAAGAILRDSASRVSP